MSTTFVLFPSDGSDPLTGITLQDVFAWCRAYGATFCGTYAATGTACVARVFADDTVHYSVMTSDGYRFTRGIDRVWRTADGDMSATDDDMAGAF